MSLHSKNHLRLKVKWKQAKFSAFPSSIKADKKMHLFPSLNCEGASHHSQPGNITNKTFSPTIHSSGGRSRPSPLSRYLKNCIISLGRCLKAGVLKHFFETYSCPGNLIYVYVSSMHVNPFLFDFFLLICTFVTGVLAENSEG